MLSEKEERDKQSPAGKNCARRLPSLLALALSVTVFSSSVAGAAVASASKEEPFFTVIEEEFLPSETLGDLERPDPPDAADAKRVFTADFETQDASLFINGAAYPFAVELKDGVAFVSAKEFFSRLYDVVLAEGGGVFMAEGEGLTVSARAGEPYIEVNGRCLPCSAPAYISEYGFMVDLAVASAALSLETEEKNGEFYVAGYVLPVMDAGSFYNPDDLYWLSHIISSESMTEPLEGKIAVGNVVLNRAASDLFPSSVKEVVLDRRYGIVQFSPVGAGTVYNEPDDESVVAAKLCLEGVSVSDEILFFMNPSLATSSWISDNRPAVMTIGRHTFYS